MIFLIKSDQFRQIKFKSIKCIHDIILWSHYLIEGTQGGRAFLKKIDKVTISLQLDKKSRI